MKKEAVLLVISLFLLVTLLVSYVNWLYTTPSQEAIKVKTSSVRLVTPSEREIVSDVVQKFWLETQSLDAEK